MDKFQALQSFWSSFQLNAYDENTVPTGDDKPSMPYITYDAAVSDFGNSVALSASLWYYGSSWSQITTKMIQIETAVGMGGKLIPCDGGALWIKKANPFAQRISDSNDMIRRILINIYAEFITAN